MMAMLPLLGGSCCARTREPLPKRHIDALLNRLYRLNVKVPVRRGDVLLADVEHTGVDVIVSCNCLK